MSKNKELEICAFQRTAKGDLERINWTENDNCHLTNDR